MACQNLDAMNMFWTRFQVSFSTKVIVPVVAIMVLLLAITVSMLNDRLREQFEADAAANLGHAESEFQRFQRFGTRNLVERLRHLRNEPRYRAVFQSGHLPTLLHELHEIE